MCKLMDLLSDCFERSSVHQKLYVALLEQGLLKD